MDLKNLDTLEDRIKYLESALYPLYETKQENEKPEEVGKKLNHISSMLKNEKLSSILKKVEEVQKFTESSESEADSIIPGSVKGEIILAKADEFQLAVGLLTKLEELSPLLNSKPIHGISDFEGNLNKILYQHTVHEENFQEISEQVIILVKKYDNLVNHLSNYLEEIEAKLARLETAAAKSGIHNMVQ